MTPLFFGKEILDIIGLMAREKVSGFLVNFDESLRTTGIYYLQRDLNPEAARTLFEAARSRGESHFEDDHERRFTLTHNSDGTYTLEQK